jgi:glycolate oxidase iron-sulfur subunit
VKDYGFMFREDPDWTARAVRVSGLARDVTEFLSEIGLRSPAAATGLAIAYHSACSMQHGQKITAQPKALLSAAGFTVREVPEGHLCCGSAGTYNLLQPELAGALRDRKIANIAATRPDAVATGNIGCIAQLAPASPVPVLHTVELLDWATGGPRPVKLGRPATPPQRR